MTKVFFLMAMLISFCSFSQSAESSFHLASNHYIHKRLPEAKATVDQGLQKYPNDAKLNALKNKLKEEEKQDQQNKDEQKKQDQQNQDQKEQKKDDKQKENKDKEQQKKEEEEQKKKDQEQKEKKPQEQDKEQDMQEKKEPQNLDREKLEQMKISEDKAKMILEAMRNQEKQYLQQQKRKATKSRDRGKPDW
jgi:Ca-activated chloride channel family protein